MADWRASDKCFGPHGFVDGAPQDLEQRPDDEGDDEPDPEGDPQRRDATRVW